MATAAEKKQAYEQWKEHCKRVQSITDTALLAGETPAQKDRRILRLQGNYAAFCEYYFPHFLTLRDKTTGEVIRTIHNAPFHNAAAAKVKGTPNLKAVFMWPRGHAKSTHMDIFVPLWLMFQPKRLINFMVVVGKSEDSATRLLGDIQAELEHNQRIIADFGKQQGNASWQDGEFKAANGVKFLACGRGQSPRGLRDREARPDYIVIDDLDDDELCRNEKRVHDITDWVKEALFGALDVGRGRFIMVGNLISKNSVLANLTKTKGVHVSVIKAIDKNGEPVWREKWTKEEAQEYRDFVGYRAWEKEMSCFLYHKVTKLKANHNTHKGIHSSRVAVLLYRPLFQIDHFQRLQGLPPLGQDWEGTAPYRLLRPAGYRFRNGTVALRPLRAYT